MSDLDPGNQPIDAVTVRCPHCGSAHPVRQQVLGKLARCTECNQRFVLRSAPAVEAAVGGAGNGAPPPLPDASCKPAAAPLDSPPPAVLPPEFPAALQAAPPAGATTATAPPPVAPALVARPKPPDPAPSATPPSLAAPSPTPTSSPPPSPPPASPQPPSFTPLPDAGTSLSAAAASIKVARPWANRCCRWIVLLCETCAAGVFALGVFWVLFLVTRAALPAEGGLSAYAVLGGAVAAAAWFTALAAGLFVFAQLLRLALQIEENTRRAAAAAERAAAASDAARPTR